MPQCQVRGNRFRGVSGNCRRSCPGGQKADHPTPDGQTFPQCTDITEIARSVEAEGADSISLINTITGMAIDVETRRPKLANITGGLSGPAIKPVALRMVWQVAQAVKVPVIGIGGIMTAKDALEFLIAGAIGRSDRNRQFYQSAYRHRYHRRNRSIYGGKGYF